MKIPLLHHFAQPLRRLWAHDKALDSVKVALAFGGVIVFCLAGEYKDWLTTLILGIIAAALAETPDRLIGRLKALLVTFACFAVSATSVRLLFPYPPLFAIGLALSSFGFVMLGALGERYGTIATASLILAVYTMLGIAQHGIAAEPFWQEPALLLAGMAFYGSISLAAITFFPNRPLRQAVAQVFNELARYLELKAELLEPVTGRNVQSLRLALATQNGKVVGLMNRAREILVLWVQIGRPARGSQSFLHWYFIAQDIHERASSAHRPYEALTEAFARSDLLFRCHHLMNSQAAACRQLSAAIASGEIYNAIATPVQALADLDAALSHVTASGNYDEALVDSLHDLRRNVSSINSRLAQAADLDNFDAQADWSLLDKDPRSLSEMWRRLRRELTPGSRRFRHGLRLAAALTAGYALLQLLGLPQGYWVMLTTVFVCQPNFSSTWVRLGQRIGGTVLGLLVASLFIASFPHPLAQLSLLLVSGVAFFVWRANRYLLATACITVLVMVCFNQFGNSYALIWPRLLDTLLGCSLAAGAVTLILPDWHGRRLHRVMANALECSVSYLDEILGQYRSGKRDDLPYRIARRNAHNADAELSSTLTGMLGEPGRYHLPADAAYRFLCVSHTLLGYISALGAHRENLPCGRHSDRIDTQEAFLQTRLKAIAGALAVRAPVPPADEPEARSADPLRLHIAHDATDTESRVLRQLNQIEAQLPELTELANMLAATK